MTWTIARPSKTVRWSALFAAAALMAACSRPEADEPVASPWLDRTATLAYWTPERMASAEVNPSPSSGRPSEPPITPGGDDIGYALAPPPYSRAMTTRLTGIVFFHDPVTNEDAHCAASVLASASQRLIVTAAHCMVAFHGLPALVWQQYPLFVPAYDGSRPLDDALRAPYGLWPLSRIYVPAIAAHNPLSLLRSDYDLAVAGAFDQLGRPLGAVLKGGFAPRVWTDLDLPGPLPRMKTMGYPSCRGALCQGEHQYPGGSQYGCYSNVQMIATKGIRLLNCGLASGSSGGGVLVEEPAGSQPRVTGVIHDPLFQTPLLPYTYPAMEHRADQDHAMPPPGKQTQDGRK